LLVCEKSFFTLRILQKVIGTPQMLGFVFPSFVFPAHFCSPAGRNSKISLRTATIRPLPRQVAKLKDAIPGVAQKTAALPDAA